MLTLPHLETNVTVACPNRCVSCNHFSPVQAYRYKQSMLAPEVLERDLRNFGRVAHAGAWAAIGGEPTLHPGLVELLDIATLSGVADTIEVWSNGQSVDRQPPEFWGAFDVLVISAYPGKITDEEIADIRARVAEHGGRVELKDERQHPNFSRLLDNTGDVYEKWRDCWFRTYSRVLDDGYFYTCCTSPFIAPVMLNLPWGHDGLRVDEYLTEEKVSAFLNRTEPLAGCSQCAGRNTRWAVPQPWAESSRSVPEWYARSAQ